MTQKTRKTSVKVVREAFLGEDRRWYRSLGDLVSLDLVLHALLDLYNRGGITNGAAIRVADTVKALPAASQWRSIDSAPKDGTEVLVFCRDTDEQLVVFWSEFNQQFVFHTYDGSIACVATAWMPLPAPPFEEETKP